MEFKTIKYQQLEPGMGLKGSPYRSKRRRLVKKGWRSGLSTKELVGVPDGGDF